MEYRYYCTSHSYLFFCDFMLNSSHSLSFLSYSHQFLYSWLHTNLCNSHNHMMETEHKSIRTRSLVVMGPTLLAQSDTSIIGWDNNHLQLTCSTEWAVQLPQWLHNEPLALKLVCSRAWTLSMLVMRWSGRLLYCWRVGLECIGFQDYPNYRHFIHSVLNAIDDTGM